MILYVLKGKAMQWVGGSLMFYACLIYVYFDAGVFTIKCASVCVCVCAGGGEGGTTRFILDVSTS